MSYEYAIRVADSHAGRPRAVASHRRRRPFVRDMPRWCTSVAFCGPNGIPLLARTEAAGYPRHVLNSTRRLSRWSAHFGSLLRLFNASPHQIAGTLLMAPHSSHLKTETPSNSAGRTRGGRNRLTPKALRQPVALAAEQLEPRLALSASSGIHPAASQASVAHQLAAITKLA